MKRGLGLLLRHLGQVLVTAILQILFHTFYSKDTGYSTTCLRSTASLHTIIFENATESASSSHSPRDLSMTEALRVA